MNLRVTYYQGPDVDSPESRSAAVAEHGQDWDEWRAMKPSYDKPGHQLGFDPDYHDEGKGFILEDGSVWTWPTQRMRPMHMAYSAKVKSLGGKVVPGTAFHIKADGTIWHYGEGRSHSSEQSEMVRQADPRLKPGGVAPPNEFDDPDLWGAFQRTI